MYNINIHSKTICNNCGKQGHSYHYCKTPITSYGIVLYREPLHAETNERQYLMIRRKHSFGFTDFVRGKYTFHNVQHLQAMFNEMSIDERQQIANTDSFDALWHTFWDSGSHEHKHKQDKQETEKETEKETETETETDTKKETEKEKEKEQNMFTSSMFRATNNTQRKNRHQFEECVSHKKFETLRHGVDINGTQVSVLSLIENSTSLWTDVEWEFPKGRRNNQSEKDVACALREFEEETGISSRLVEIVSNVCQFEELYLGSNFKLYKHKYFIARLKGEHSDVSLSNFQPTEVSDVRWFTLDECIHRMRSYQVEKQNVIKNVHHMLQSCSVEYVD